MYTERVHTLQTMVPTLDSSRVDYSERRRTVAQHSATIHQSQLNIVNSIAKRFWLGVCVVWLKNKRAAFNWDLSFEDDFVCISFQTITEIIDKHILRTFAKSPHRFRISSRRKCTSLLSAPATFVVVFGILVL